METGREKRIQYLGEISMDLSSRYGKDKEAGSLEERVTMSIDILKRQQLNEADDLPGESCGSDEGLGEEM